jgi:hypothetical protein
MKTIHIIFALVVLAFAQASGQQAFSNIELGKHRGQAAINFTLPSEANVFNFRIEGGNDGHSFEIVGVLPSTGNAVLAKSYHYSLYEPTFKYYRVVMVGQDSRMHYSPLVTVETVKRQDQAPGESTNISAATLVGNQK